MKTKQIKQVMLIGCVLLIGVVICVSVWFFLSKYRAMEIQDQSQQPVPNISKGVNNETSKTVAAANGREEPVTRREIIARQSRKMFTSLLSDEQLANPHFQKMLEVMDSPEFLDLLEKDLTEWQWNDFMESKGVTVSREFPGLFGKVVPNTELADYEQEVCLKLAELFIAAEPVDLTDPKAAARQRSSVYLQLGEEFTKTDMAAVAWFIERFGECRDGAFRWDAVNNPAFIWMTNIQQNAASIVASAKTTEVDAPETQASAPSWDLSSVMESASTSPDETSGDLPSMAVPVPDAAERPTNPNTVPRTAGTPAPELIDVPTAPTHLPTVEGLETSLKEQFSSERFDRAMSTLERYGPEEGLRRLRESDPEVANQIERHHKRASKEEDSR